ncbi:MAG TPA: phosphoenolpyruvate--protein phosphotransferase, partial [Rhodothermales bacterium]
RPAGEADAAAGPRVERVLRGIGVAHGIAIGPAFLYARESLTVVERQIDAGEVHAELERFEEAVGRSERDLRKIASVARDKLGDASADIFEAQALMLRDDALYEAVVRRIRSDLTSADSAVQAVMSKHRQLMMASDSEYLRERADDLQDVQERIIRHLRRGRIMSNIDHGSIVVAENLTAADIILFSRRNILGCATDFGGATSHVSIMARALDVPAVVGMHGITDVVQNGDLLVLDGLQGQVIVNPSDETLNYYREQQKRFQRFLQEQKHLAPLPPETLDGHRVVLRANLEFREELRLLTEYGAEGIGLFRTEILFLMRGRITLSEDAQYELFRSIVEASRPHPVTFRVLDLGGDKMLPMAHREQNPFLGWRGIRVLLDKPDILIPQLRAIFRASAHGPTRVLLPMVTNLDEVRRFYEHCEQVREDLAREGVPFDEHIQVGIMVEVPAVALMAHQFAPDVDFFSIGSNDLTQYALAVDRGNDLVSDKFDELHPAVLALMKSTVDAAHANGISVSICGEIAGNPRATALLVGLGVDELSASPTYLPEVKRIVRSMHLSKAKALAESALLAGSAAEVDRMVDDWLAENACEVSQFVERPRDLRRGPNAEA